MTGVKVKREQTDKDVGGRTTVDFEALYREEGRKIWGALFAFAGGDREVAEDALAESFVRAMEHTGLIENPLAYIYTIAFRAAKADVRARGKEPTTPTTHPSDEPQDLSDLIWALKKLSPGQRAAVVLHYEVGLPVAEIAEISGVSASTVKVQLHRGRNKLRSLLGTEEVTND